MRTVSAPRPRAPHHAHPPRGEPLVFPSLQEVGCPKGQRGRRGRVACLQPSRIGEDLHLILLVPSKQRRAGSPRRLLHSAPHSRKPNANRRTRPARPEPPIPRSSVETLLVIPAHRGDGVHLRTREATRLLDHPDNRVSARAQHQPPGQLLTHRHCLAAQPSIRRLETDRTLQIINAPQSAWPRQRLHRVLEDHQPLITVQLASHRTSKPTFTSCEKPLGIKDHPSTYSRVRDAKEASPTGGVGEVVRHTQTIHSATDVPACLVQRNFEKRKVAIGTCARAFGTPCIHEHACVRCSLLRPDPAQRDRLVEIRDNLLARIAEAEREGWLGEVEGLQVSLAGANDKLAQLERRARNPTTVDLGIPTIAKHSKIARTVVVDSSHGVQL
jgi:hypothetical protein